MLRRCVVMMGIIVILGSVTVLVSGCDNYFLEDVVQAFSTVDTVDTFYGEGVQREIIDGKTTEEISFKEWKGHGSDYRINTVAKVDKAYYEEAYHQSVEGNEAILKREYVYNACKVVIHYPEQNKYAVRPVSLEDDVKGALTQGINTFIYNGSTKKCTMSLISELSQKYNVTIEDDVKLNGRYTQHITASPKDKGNKGEIAQYWIDQQNWLIVKMCTKQGNYEMEFEYTHYQINPSIDDSQFEMDIDKSADVEYVGLNMETFKERMTIEAARQKFKNPIYRLEEKNGINLVSTQYIERFGEPDATVKLTYKIPDGKEVIVENTIAYQVYNNLDLGYDHIELNGKEVWYMEDAENKMIQFTSDKVVCYVYVKNSAISKEAFIDIAKQLVVME